jgi:hypothetical protein
MEPLFAAIGASLLILAVVSVAMIVRDIFPSLSPEDQASLRGYWRGESFRRLRARPRDLQRLESARPSVSSQSQATALCFVFNCWRSCVDDVSVVARVCSALNRGLRQKQFVLYCESQRERPRAIGAEQEAVLRSSSG